MNANRRSLQFQSLDEIIPDVDRLVQGHSTVGAWTLGQICEHLATVTRVAVDAPASTRHDPSLRVGDDQKRQVFESGRLPEGLPLAATLAPPDAIPAAEGAEKLRKALAYYQSSPSPVVEHRLFGPLTKDEWDRVICVHCAHHLSFAIPKVG